MLKFNLLKVNVKLFDNFVSILLNKLSSGVYMSKEKLNIAIKCKIYVLRLQNSICRIEYHLVIQSN